MSNKLVSRPALPKRPGKPGMRRAQEVPTFPKLDEPQGPDEFGLGWWAHELCRRARQCIAKHYEEFAYDKRYQPSEVMDPPGTVPEAVLYGWLSLNGFGYRRGSPSWEKQDPRLGGREFPGGAVLDGIVRQRGLNIGVRVHSPYHSLQDPFGKGGSETEEARQQRVRLLSRGGIDRIIDVNLTEQGYPLENGPDHAIDSDLERIRRIA